MFCTWTGGMRCSRYDGEHAPAIVPPSDANASFLSDHPVVVNISIEVASLQVDTGDMV